MPGKTNLDALAELEPSHLLRFTARDAAAALAAAHACLAQTPAQVRTLTIHPLGSWAEGVLRVGQLDETAARALSDHLAGRPGVLSAQVEHQWVRP